MVHQVLRLQGGGGEEDERWTLGEGREKRESSRRRERDWTPFKVQGAWMHASADKAQNVSTGR
eukprot:9481803-Pyramimonas_sp.AAC.1